MTNQFDNILHSGDCISEELLLKYIAGKADHPEQHRIEKHLLDCEFCRDALEGLSLQKSRQLQIDLRELDQQIDQRVGAGEIKTTVTSSMIYRIAAVVALVSLIGGGIYYLQSVKKSEKIFTENFVPYRDTLNAPSAIATGPVSSDIGPGEKIIDAVKQSEQSGSQKGKSNIPLQQSGNFKTDLNTKSVSIENLSQTTTESALAKDVVRNGDVTKLKNEEKESAPVIDDIGVDKKNNVSDESKKINLQERSIQPSVFAREENSKKQSSAKDKNAATTSPSTGYATTAGAENQSIHDVDLLNSGIALYHAKDYSSAITNFQQLLTKDPSNKEALFYCGVSNLNIGNYNLTINQLEAVLSNPPVKFLDAAKWYLSLAYIKKNKTSKAKKLLEDLSMGNSEYKAAAQKTLNELK